jgi:hypothetical protein
MGLPFRVDRSCIALVCGIGFLQTDSKSAGFVQLLNFQPFSRRDGTEQYPW